MSIADGEKAFPEGTKLRVYPIEDEDAAEYIEAIESQHHIGVADPLSMDIVVMDQEGNYCQPSGAVSLSFSGPGIDADSKVWHIKDLSGAKAGGVLKADDLTAPKNLTPIGLPAEGHDHLDGQHGHQQVVLCGRSGSDQQP